MRRARELIRSKFPDGINLIQPSDSLEINREIYDYEAYTIYRNIKSEDIVFDVGASVGIFTLKAAKKANFVIAVEPDPYNYNLLLRNIKNNKLENILPIQKALSNFVGQSDLEVGSSSFYSTISLQKISPKLTSRRKYGKYDMKIVVDVTTIDEIVESENIERVDFIKIDAEGAELEIIEGANKTIDENNGVYLSVAAEHYEYQPIEIIKYLSKKGFKCLGKYFESQHSWHVYASR